MIPILLIGAAYLIGKTMDGNNFEEGGKVPLLAPNGKPSKLTPEQWHLVRTLAFKKWFGDWENSPENASKIVDENGEPLVVYRGNRKNQDELGYQFNLGNNFLEKPSANNFGFFFTDRIDIAKKYMDVDVWDEVKGGSLTSVFLKSEKMLDLTDFGLQIGQESFIEGLKHKGISFIGYENLIDRVLYYFDDNTYEGWGAWVFDYFDIFPELRYLFLKNGITSILFLEKSRNYFNYNVYVVFDSKEIKLADGTNTTFDGSNPDIRFENGGVLDFTSSKSMTIKLGGDLYKVQYQRGEVGDTDRNVWFANVISKNGKQVDGNLYYCRNDLYLNIVDDLGIEIETRHIEYNPDIF